MQAGVGSGAGSGHLHPELSQQEPTHQPSFPGVSIASSPIGRSAASACTALGRAEGATEPVPAPPGAGLPPPTPWRESETRPKPPTTVTAIQAHLGPTAALRPHSTETEAQDPLSAAFIFTVTRGHPRHRLGDSTSSSNKTEPITRITGCELELMSVEMSHRGQG